MVLSRGEERVSVPQSAHRGISTTDVSSSLGRLRLWAVLAGVLAVATALSIPFLPVRQEQSSISWPQAGAVSSVTAPLVSYAPTELSAEIPCAAFDALPAGGGVVLSTIPRQSPDMARYGLVVEAVPATADRRGRVDIVVRKTVLWSAPLSAVAGQSCTLTIAIDAQRAIVSGGPADSSNTLDTDVRPQVVGLFTELTGAPPQGLRVDVEVDSRFTSAPSVLKLIAIAICLLATLAALVLLHRLDTTDGRSARRFLPAGWWRLRPVDALVATTLVVWHFIGANTSDDGYQLGMVRASDSSGYMANYFRWFGVAEAPIGTPYYDLLAWMAKLSAASPWMRLPALLAGIVTWWVISREVIPRLGAAVRTDRIAVWTSALVFLAFWLPYNNGLRPEPIVALGLLLTWCSVERAIATRRLLPAAAAFIIGALTLTVGPSGLICFAALFAGARGLTQIIVDRARQVGYLPLLLPLLAAGLVVLTAVFADQTLAGVREMAHVHGLIGPREPWFFEYLRYQWLLQINADGWLTRRFGVFVLLLGVSACLVTMLRRGGRIPGTSLGPSQRIVGVTFGAMILMMFTPTKWTHHFGVFAALAGVIAALTAVAVSPAVMRPLRNRALFAAAVFFLLAMSFVGTNGYWYASSWGVPWATIPPEILGKGLSTFFAALTVFALAAAAWFHIRPSHTPPGSAATRIGRIPVLAVAAAAMVAFEVLSFVKATVAQYPSFSLASSNVAALSGGCGLADQVLVETDPNASMLRPLSGDIATALAGTRSTGFTNNGVAADLTSEETETDTSLVNSVKNPDAEPETAGTESGTSSGTGINGSSVPLPFGLEPATTPVLGSYRDSAQEPAELISDWYQLSGAATTERGQIIAIAAAGRIRSVDRYGVVRPGQDMRLEYGRRQPDGSVTTLGKVVPIDIGPAPSWRNLRVPLNWLPNEADVVRIVAEDSNADKDQWLAVTPPRIPQTRTLNAVVGSEVPVLLDWTVGLSYPCQRLMPTYAGVGVLPAYRILPDRNGAAITDLWQGHDGGGPLGWIQLLLRPETLPTYLNNAWDRDWGSLQRYSPLDPSADPAQVTIEYVRRSGIWTPGHINTQY
ncbi:arabinosyltransferase domain-containing protein [Nocardia sp. 004]|uniref:arabinosyltransferase domain-containing protein n=1 Tax=Nocardia sp. 004 TaxID=3385978 RepID=UPI00399FC6F2